MANTQGAGLLGQKFAQQIRSTIARVEGTPFGGGVTKIPTDLSGDTSYVPKTFRICTVTGAWNINETKTVTFRGVTTTPNTVSAVNLFTSLTTTQGQTSQPCAIAKDGTAWYLIGAQTGVVRGTFSGAWAKGATATVTDAVTSGKKYTVKNYIASLATSGTVTCSIAQVGDEWVLVAWDWTALSGHDGTKQQVLAHNASGQLVWLNTTACT